VRPSISLGAAFGALAIAALIAISFGGWIIAGLPFPPFDMFDWTARALPGWLVTFVIEMIVYLSRPFTAAGTSSVAKIGEQATAVAASIAGGALGGALLYGLVGLSNEPATFLGACFGTIGGGLVLAMEISLDRVESALSIEGVSILAMGFAWGLAIGFAYDSTNQARVLPSGERLAGTPAGDRRRFLVRFAVVSAATAAAGLVAGLFRNRPTGMGFGRWSATHPLPNAGASVIPVPGTRPEFTPLERHYRVDMNTRPPVINARRWKLRVRGLVRAPLDLAIDEVRGFEPLHQFVTLSCISNPVGGDLIGTTRWTGVSLATLLSRIDVLPSATHLKVTSADGFWEVVAIDTILRDSRVMLAYDWDGVPLPTEHGFPLRVYVPDVYGMKQPKWVVSIDAINHWEAGYWVSRGWDREGRVKATAVIDVVDPVGGAEVPNVAEGGNAADHRRTVAVGGIAYAGARGISRVEARVDDGEWQPARLRQPLSETTWVVWRADVLIDPGDHVVSVRCYDRDGMLQSTAVHSRRAEVAPAGAPR
jgi:DMSO/TMAO reductase YedYZ molybdopterin-dependent catalytic subunit